MKIEWKLDRLREVSRSGGRVGTETCDRCKLVQLSKQNWFEEELALLKFHLNLA